MSHMDVSRFITHALDDEHLRHRMKTDPDSAFSGYNLTDEEKTAIARWDEQKLRHLGLDPMTARSWSVFHDTEHFAPDMPNAPHDLPPKD